jgi:phosphatidate phosphatase APP1
MFCIGMPEVYRGWKSKHNCSFHYLSAMPDQLYAITKDFIDEHQFPDGTFHMRYDLIFFKIIVIISFQ